MYIYKCVCDNSTILMTLFGWFVIDIDHTVVSSHIPCAYHARGKITRLQAWSHKGN